MNSNQSSPIKNSTTKSSSKVIDDLHQKIDDMTAKLTNEKLLNQELTKKNQILSTKNSSYMDQVANIKHENDMLSALLKRKERRIIDLENEYQSIIESNESLSLQQKQIKIRYDNLQKTSQSSVEELERLKVNYDTLETSLFAYQKHYKGEIDKLSTSLNEFKISQSENWKSSNESINNNNSDMEFLIDSLSNKKKSMDNIYNQKNNKILFMLTNLTKLINLNGVESRNLVEENSQTIQLILEKYPDLQEKIMQHEKIDIDISDILTQSKECIENVSFEEDSTTSTTEDKHNDLSIKKRKNKRNSTLFKESPIMENSSFSNISSSKKPQLNNNIINIPKNTQKQFHTKRQSTPPKYYSDQDNQQRRPQSNHDFENHQHRRQPSNNDHDHHQYRRQPSNGGTSIRRNGSVHRKPSNNNQKSKRRSTYIERNSQLLDQNFSI